jgi:ketosteroid isomerase-like protein
MTSDHNAQLQWLVDRAQISDLLFSFARAIDTKDWQAYANNFTETGVLELPWPTADGITPAGHNGRAGLADYVAKGLGGFVATHHLSANHQITVDGDTATSTSYCQCIHRRSEDDISDVWELGGWYTNSYLRTADGWKFTRVRLEAIWQTGAIADPAASH